MLALIVNRVHPDHMEAINAAFASRPADAPPVWALPEDDGLHYPTLAELGRALDAELVAGDHDDLNREVRHVKVAAMSVPNLLDHVEEGTDLHRTRRPPGCDRHRRPARGIQAPSRAWPASS